jgi:hypothetical protein
MRHAHVGMGEFPFAVGSSVSDSDFDLRPCPVTIPMFLYPFTQRAADQHTYTKYETRLNTVA